MSGVLVSRELPGGSIWTRVWMSGEVVVALLPPLPAGIDAARLLRCDAASMPSTSCTPCSVSALDTFSAEVASTESAETTVCATSVVAFGMPARATWPSTVSAAACVLVESVSLLADRMASTSDAADAAATADRLLAAVTYVRFSSCWCATTPDADGGGTAAARCARASVRSSEFV